MKLRIRRVAVLGAGVMGAQLAAQLTNLGIPVRLFDLAGDAGHRDGIVRAGLDRLDKIKPPAWAAAGLKDQVQVLNYDDDLGRLADCDLVIEAIAERLDWKLDLYHRIAPHLGPRTILVSNTSGLSIERLAQGLDDEHRQRFCGVHFFNPPRYMPLVELIPCQRTAPVLLEELETFLTTVLGKSVIIARDTPNFIANRIGVAGTVFTLLQGLKRGLSFDLIDDLTGPRIGRARSGTCRTVDLVGIDVLTHVIATSFDQAPDDPFHDCFAPLPLLEGMKAAGALGAKVGAGFYRKEGQAILRLDPATRQYVAAGARADAEVQRCLELPVSQRLAALRALDHPEAQFLWAIQRDLFHYCAHHLASIAGSARDLDLAMRWGFGWNEGPFETWQRAGWSQVARWIAEDIEAGRSLVSTPLPDWVLEVGEGVHGPRGSWDASSRQWVAPPETELSRRQYFPIRLAGEAPENRVTAARTVFENPTLRVWTPDDQVLVVSLQNKMNLLGAAALEGLNQALDEAERGFGALVLWSPAPQFSAGGDLAGFLEVYNRGGLTGLDHEQRRFQEVVQRLRTSLIPTVAAVRGFALGGGCEVLLHCDRRVAHLESNIGLVEVNVGLLPGAGGLTALARRAGMRAQAEGMALRVSEFLKADLGRVMRCEVSNSALEARQWGWLTEGDVILPNADELLHGALVQARGMIESAYRPPLASAFPVAGREGWASLLAELVNYQAGGWISEYDLAIGKAVLEVLCGGALKAGTLVTESTLLALERHQFAELLSNIKSRERIRSFLETGRAIRN